MTPEQRFADLAIDAEDPLAIQIKVQAARLHLVDVIAEIEDATVYPRHPDVDNCLDLLQQSADMIGDAALELIEPEKRKPADPDGPW